MIPALVLTAGLATRLRPLSLVRAKAALPVAGEPLVRRILRQLAAAGVPHAVLNLHHLPHTITGVVGDGSDLGIAIRYSWENPVLGSAGGPRRAIPLLTDVGRASGSSFFIVNGDTLTDVDLGALARAHDESGALVTMAVIPNDRPDKYGGLVVRDGGVFTKTLPRGSAEPSYHFVGVQVVDRAAFTNVPDNVSWESVARLYPALVAERPNAVRVFPCTTTFDDIGTPADYLDTSLRLAAQDRDNVSPDGSRIDSTAHIERSIVWNDVSVEAGARLHECIVTDGVRVPGHTSWERVTLRAVAANEALAPNEQRIGELGVAPF
jgi:mannose-1-phosphate guanylyltransferase